MNLTNKQSNAVVLFRILVGWHFFYEGITKLYNPAWTSQAYLNSASGPFKKIFELLGSDGIIEVVDFLNIAGLAGIGLLLILGFWEKPAALAGVVLLLFYYFSQPPFPGLEQVGAEGNYLFVNKNLIEASGLLVIYCFPTGAYFGLQRFFSKEKNVQLN